MSSLVTREWPLPLSVPEESVLGAYLKHHPAAHYRQSLEWLAAVGAEQMRVFVTRRGEDIVAASMVEHRPSRLPFAATARIARGPLFDDDESLAAHLEAVQGTLAGTAGSLRISPFVDRQSVTLPPGWETITPSAFYDATLIVPVQPSDAEQWRSMRRSTRTSINRARRNGLAVGVRSGEAAFRSFVGQYNAFADSRGLGRLDETVMARLARYASVGRRDCAGRATVASDRRGSCLLLEARGGGECLGAALFMRNGRALAYEWGWTGTAANGARMPVLHPILWSAIEFCRDSGIDELDLGGYWPERGNDDPINHVKLGFSKRERRYLPEQRIVISPLRHAAAEALGGLRKMLGR